MNSYEMFIAVTELKSLSAAAERLNRSPSAISKQLSQLESRLGIQLFQRSTRAIQLTPAGERYYEKCLEIVQKMKLAELEISEYVSEPSGPLTLNWPNVLSSSEVVRSLSDFCARYPDIRLNVKVFSEEVDFHRDKIDVALRVTFLEDPRLVAWRLSEVKPIFCATPELLARCGHPSSLQEVLDLPQVNPTYVPIARYLAHFFPQLRWRDDGHHQADDISAVSNMLKMGLGAGFIGKHVIQRELDEGTLIDLTGDTLPVLPIYLLYPRQSYMPMKCRVLVDFFKERFV